MINLDQLQPDQNTPLLDHKDWQQKAPPPPASISNPAPQKFTADPRPPTDPVTPADAVDPVPAPSAQNPSPETPGDLLSAPNDDNDSSSSLSPAPEREEDRERARADPPVVSRQSTPLTELSGPATPSRAKEEDTAERVNDPQPRPLPKPEGEDGEGKSDGAEDAATVVAVDAPVEGDKVRPPPAAPDAVVNVPNKAPESAVAAANGSSSPATGTEPATAEAQQPADEKASAILQLNTELLKVCIECQARNIMQTPEFNTYAARLQSNLTWLAAAADRARQTQIPLPIMSPPASLPFVPPERERILALYQRLPILFAREIAKRQREGLKRSADSADQPIMRKRLDTGERRLGGENMNMPASMGATAGSPPHARSPSVVSNGAGAHVSMSPEALGMMTPQQQQQPSTMRVSPESAAPQQQPPQAFPQNMGAGSGALSEAQLRERQRQMAAMRSQAQAQAQNMAKDRMPPPPTAGTVGGPSQMSQAILASFGQAGLQNYHALQQGAGHPFVNYMVNNVQGFMQLPLQQQLQRMALVQNNIQQVRAHQAQRAAAAAAAAAGMNGSTPQGIPDAGSPFSRHSGSPPNLNPGEANSFQGLANPGMMPGMGMGMGAQPNSQQMRMGMQQPGQMQPSAAGPRPTSSQAQGPMNVASLTPQHRQLLLMQQQMHSRGGDSVMNPTAQQAYAEKMRQGLQMQQQQQQQQNQQPQHSPGSPPADGSGTPRMPQKRVSSGMGQPDPYHMALYNTQQRQAAAAMRSGPQQQQVYSGTVNPGMMYGGMGVNPNPTPTPGPGQQQAWQTPQQQQPQQQPFHTVSPAALQHHPDAGTPRPESSASNNAVAPADTMDSFESLFNWGGT